MVTVDSPGEKGEGWGDKAWFRGGRVAAAHRQAVPLEMGAAFFFCLSFSVNKSDLRVKESEDAVN